MPAIDQRTPSSRAPVPLLRLRSASMLGSPSRRGGLVAPIHSVGCACCQDGRIWHVIYAHAWSATFRVSGPVGHAACIPTTTQCFALYSFAFTVTFTFYSTQSRTAHWSMRAVFEQSRRCRPVSQGLSTAGTQGHGTVQLRDDCILMSVHVLCQCMQCSCEAHCRSAYPQGPLALQAMGRCVAAAVHPLNKNLVLPGLQLGWATSPLGVC